VGVARQQHGVLRFQVEAAIGAVVDLDVFDGGALVVAFRGHAIGIPVRRRVVDDRAVEQVLVEVPEYAGTERDVVVSADVRVQQGPLR
jgi:hypothetical protein